MKQPNLYDDDYFESDPLKVSERSIASFFIIAHRNHIQLSGMADKKANIILAVSAMLISGVLTSSYKLFEGNLTLHSYLLIPTAILLVTTLGAMILSILTTMPKLSSGTFKKDDVLTDKVNLAFFGNFHKMSLEDYEWAVKYMQTKNKEMNVTLTQDLYFLGVVLDKKFKILQAAYWVLVIGIIISVIAYIIAFNYQLNLS